MICTPAGPSEPIQSDPLEFRHHPIEPLAAELAAAQCSTEVSPIEELRACCRQRRRDACSYEQLLYILLSSVIYVAYGSRGLGVVVGPSAHADFQGGTVSEPMAPERREALFAGLKSLDVSDDRFRGDLFPMLDHPGMKSAEVGEVPIEAAARDAKLARKHIRFQSIEALVCERPHGEINPVLYGQSLGHDAAPYSAVLTATMCGDIA